MAVGRDRYPSQVETIALERIKSEVGTPHHPTPGIVFIRATEDDVKRQQGVIDTLRREQDALTPRIKTARTKLGLDKK